MRSLIRHVQLRPHGDDMLTSSTAFWLVSAGVLVAIMATVEAVAWGYLGYMFGQGPWRWVGAAIVGTFIFLVVWMIDASLVTMDRAWREHAQAILGQDTRDRARSVRTALTFCVRIGLLAGSMYITAPYLAQVVFMRDIERLLADEATKNIDTTRAQIESKYDAQIGAKAKEASAAREAYQREVAGKGLSGRYGYGDAAKALNAELEKRVAERDLLERQRLEAVAAFNQVAKDWTRNRDTIASRYNVELPAESILQNRRALEELRKRPENQSTELAIKAFLAFIFAGLLLLKLFEPHSVRLYMSDVLQEEYERYKRGIFDDTLQPAERSDIRPLPMTPQRLLDFLVRVWVPQQHREADVAKRLADAAAAERSLRQLEEIRLHITAEVSAAKKAYDAACEQLDKALQSTSQLKNTMEVVRGDILAFQARLERWQEEEEKDPLDEQSRFERSGVKSQMRQKLTDAHKALDRLLEHAPVEDERQRRAEAERDRASRAWQVKQEELDSLSGKIREARVKSTGTDINWSAPATSAGRSQ